MDKSKYFLIVNKETEKQYLLSLNDWRNEGVPKGYARTTTSIPLPEKFRDLPMYENKKHLETRMDVSNLNKLAEELGFYSSKKCTYFPKK